MNIVFVIFIVFYEWPSIAFDYARPINRIHTYVSRVARYVTGVTYHVTVIKISRPESYAGTNTDNYATIVCVYKKKKFFFPPVGAATLVVS